MVAKRGRCKRRRIETANLRKENTPPNLWSYIRKWRLSNKNKWGNIPAIPKTKYKSIHQKQDTRMGWALMERELHMQASSNVQNQW